MVRLFLCARDGTVVRTYNCERMWGAIWHDGVRYVAQHKGGLPNVYVPAEETT